MHSDLGGTVSFVGVVTEFFIVTLVVEFTVNSGSLCLLSRNSLFHSPIY